MDIPNSNSYEMLIEGFAKGGFTFSGFAERDILASVFGGIAGKDREVFQLAENALACFGSVEGTLSASAKELRKAGLTELEAENVIFISRMIKRAALERYPMPFSADDQPLMESYLKTLFACENKELMYMFPAKGRMICACIRLAEGDEKMVQFDQDRLLAHLVGYDGYVLAHNHPNASCQPSRADVVAGKYLAGKLKKAGFDHICHYTVGKDGVGIVLGEPNYIEIFLRGADY